VVAASAAAAAVACLAGVWLRQGGAWQHQASHTAAPVAAVAAACRRPVAVLPSCWAAAVAAACVASLDQTKVWCSAPVATAEAAAAVVKRLSIAAKG
jgi:hypothetical protein